MNSKEKLKEIAYKIDLEINRVLDAEIQKSKSISPIVELLLDNIRSVTADGGKRLRGAFVYYSYKMCGGIDEQSILETTPFIELIHSYLLIHDDIMDKAKHRRGLETIHSRYRKVYNQRNQNRDKSIHFGNSIAINAGDLINHLGVNILTNSNFDSDLKLKALNIVNRGINDVVYGQVLDIFGEIENVDEKYVLDVYRYKTGMYTYENPLHVGATLANADENTIEILSEYAIPGGIAFQIVDDIIDIFSNFEQTGKANGQDLKEGKKTLLIIKAYENATPKQKIELDRCLGNKDITPEDIELIKEIIRKTGSLDYSKTLANNLLEKSSMAILKNKNKFEPIGSDFLIGINKFMYERIYNEENNSQSK